MAKKTNKTEHVLNLLLGQNEASEKAPRQAGLPQGSEQNQVVLNQEVANQTIINQTVKEKQLDETPVQSRPDSAQTDETTGVQQPELKQAEGTQTEVKQKEAGQAEGTQTEAGQPKEKRTENTQMNTGFSETQQSEAVHPENAPAPPLPSSPPSGIKFVESTKNENNPISSAIKESLEREAVQMGIIPPPQDDRAGQQERSSSDGRNKPAGNQENASFCAGDEDPFNGRDKADANTEAPPKEIKEITYLYLNVMEEGVKEDCEEYMIKLGVCTCDRCRNDVMALALSNLPPKYIVTEKTAVSPLLNLYRNKFSSYVMAELTKACFAVSANPRH